MRVQLTINIDSGNDSFQDDPLIGDLNRVHQLEKILRNIIRSLYEGGGTGSVYDDNGNHVGFSKLELSEDEE